MIGNQFLFCTIFIEIPVFIILLTILSMHTSLQHHIYHQSASLPLPANSPFYASSLLQRKIFSADDIGHLQLPFYVTKITFFFFLFTFSELINICTLNYINTDPRVIYIYDLLRLKKVTRKVAESYKLGWFNKNQEAVQRPLAEKHFVL